MIPSILPVGGADAVSASSSGGRYPIPHREAVGGMGMGEAVGGMGMGEGWMGGTVN
jgi:hypothetical protein